MTSVLEDDQEGNADRVPLPASDVLPQACVFASGRGADTNDKEYESIEECGRQSWRTESGIRKLKIGM